MQNYASNSLTKLGMKLKLVSWKAEVLLFRTMQFLFQYDV